MERDERFKVMDFATQKDISLKNILIKKITIFSCDICWVEFENEEECKNHINTHLKSEIRAAIDEISERFDEILDKDSLISFNTKFQCMFCDLIQPVTRGMVNHILKIHSHDEVMGVLVK